MSRINQNFLDWYAARLLIAVYDTNQEHRTKMAVQVKGLADTVRQAKAAIDKASTVADRVNKSAAQLVQTMADVEAMTTQLDSANADLQAALGTVTNGAPPLETGGKSPAATSTGLAQGGPDPSGAGTPSHDIHAAKIKVETDNAARVTATADKYIPPVAPVTP